MAHTTDGDGTRVVTATDTDWAACQATRKSTACAVVKFAGVIISVSCRSQSIVAKSSPEAEYYGVAMGLAEGMHVQSLAAFLGYKTRHQLECDAQSAIAMASRRGLGAVRHIEVQYLWVQDVMRSSRVHLKKVNGDGEPPRYRHQALAGGRVPGVPPPAGPHAAVRCNGNWLHHGGRDRAAPGALGVARMLRYDRARGRVG